MYDIVTDTTDTNYETGAALLDLIVHTCSEWGIDLDGVESATDIAERVRECDPDLLDAPLLGEGGYDPTLGRWLTERAADITRALEDGEADERRRDDVRARVRKGWHQVVRYLAPHLTSTVLAVDDETCDLLTVDDAWQLGVTLACEHVRSRAPTDDE